MSKRDTIYFPLCRFVICTSTFNAKYIFMDQRRRRNRRSKSGLYSVEQQSRSVPSISSLNPIMPQLQKKKPQDEVSGRQRNTLNANLLRLSDVIYDK